ncbi:MAG: hypothetical protein IIC53_07890 [Proteobacteria bacterium]|nr:hypothetical protein [Pseudomonadota bacterium]
MTTLFYSHPASLDHDTGAMHPESPARFEAVLAALEAPAFAGLERREAPPAAPAQLARVHAEETAVFDRNRELPVAPVLSFDAECYRDSIVSHYFLLCRRALGKDG